MDKDALREYLNTKRQGWPYEDSYHVDHMGGHRFVARIGDELKIIENNYIGTIPIIMVGINDIDAFGISVKHYSNAVIEILYQYLKTAFAIAEEEAIIAYNPMKSKRIRRPKSDRGDKKVKAFTKEEQDRLIDTMIKTEPPYGCNDFRLQI